MTNDERSRIDELLRQAAEAIHEAFEESRSPSEDPKVQALLHAVNGLRNPKQPG